MAIFGLLFWLTFGFCFTCHNFSVKERGFNQQGKYLMNILKAFLKKRKLLSGN